MKKVFSVFMSLLLIFALTACSSQNAENADINSNGTDVLQADRGEIAVQGSSSTPSNQTSGGKTLVVYFSATGNTKEVAGYIASATGGDLFELVPVKPYSSEDLNWNDENSRVVYEHEHPAERNVALVKTTVDHFDEYDTVFIGYPIWWGIAAWPVDSFVKANDFTGKTVIPFCTSASSGLGESGRLLKEMAGTGTWLDGIRFASGESQTEVINRLASLGYETQT